MHSRLGLHALPVQQACPESPHGGSLPTTSTGGAAASVGGTSSFAPASLAPASFAPASFAPASFAPASFAPASLAWTVPPHPPRPLAQVIRATSATILGASVIAAITGPVPFGGEPCTQNLPPPNQGAGDLLFLEKQGRAGAPRPRNAPALDARATVRALQQHLVDVSFEPPYVVVVLVLLTSVGG